MERLRFLFNRRPVLSQRHDHGLVPGRAQEFYQIGARKPGGAGIDQRMKVEPLMAHHCFVQNDPNLAGSVVDCAERRDRARPDAPHVFQELGGAEGDAPLRADFLVHALEVDDQAGGQASGAKLNEQVGAAA